MMDSCTFQASMWRGVAVVLAVGKLEDLDGKVGDLDGSFDAGWLYEHGYETLHM